jgi:hypothetical protein
MMHSRSISEHLVDACFDHTPTKTPSEIFMVAFDEILPMKKAWFLENLKKLCKMRLKSKKHPYFYENSGICLIFIFYFFNLVFF